MIATELTYQLLQKDYQSNAIVKAEYDFSNVRALQTDEENLYKRLNIGVKGGWISIAEARSKVGLPTTDDQNIYYVPINVNPTQAPSEMTENVEEEEQLETQEDVDQEFEESAYVIDETKIIRRENGEFCVYNEEGTRRFGCYPTRELAESRLAQIHSFGESQYEEIDLKEEIAKDEFTTIEEARERAEELGCSGTHTHDDDGRLIYMPCATHEEYERRLAEEDGDS